MIIIINTRATVEAQNKKYQNMFFTDLAVGAYRSGEVFLFYGLTIIDYKLTLNTNVSTINGGDTIRVTYCLYYSQRSPSQRKKSADFEITLNLDYRTDGKVYYKEPWTVPLKNDFCKDLEVKIVVCIDPMQHHNKYFY